MARKTIELWPDYRITHLWVSTHSDPAVRDDFGTADIPTPFACTGPNKVSGRDVIRTVQSQNPDAVVSVRYRGNAS